MKQSKFGILAKTTLLSGAALTLMGMPASALAQAADEAAAEDEDVIVVTARKREEGVQTVPIAITALTAADLEERNISSLASLGSSTPGLSITQITGGSFTNIYYRGLAPANSANDLNVDANVGIFINGIYQTSRNTADVLSVLDIGQIEAAKGPQSAVYGRSTFAGALGITTRGAASSPEADFTATIGTHSDYRLKGSISAPLIEGILHGRLSAGFQTYDGFGRNLSSPGDRLGGSERFGANAVLEFTPSERFTAKLSGYVTKARIEQSPLSLILPPQNNCGGNDALSLARYQFCGDLPVQKVSNISAGIKESEAVSRQIALDMAYDFDDFSIVSVTGLTSARLRSANDYDGTSGGVTFGVCTFGVSCGSFFAPATYTRTVNVNSVLGFLDKVKTFSQEIRVQSKEDSPLQWTLGGFYFNSRIPLSQSFAGTDRATLAPNEGLVRIDAASPPGTGAAATLANAQLVGDSNNQLLLAGSSFKQTKTYSVFGALGYDFGNGLRINAEGRYNVDKKTDGCTLTFFGLFGPCPTPPGGSQPLRGKYKTFTPRFTVDYQVTPDIFLYASAAKGVTSGGFNQVGGIFANEVSYDPEENWTFEAGAKSDLFDDHLRLNLSVFHTDWKDMQISAFSAAPGAFGLAQIITNAGDLKSTGVEAQAEVKLSDMFSFGGSFTYADPKFKAGAYDPASIVQCGGSADCEYITITTAAGPTVVPSLAGNRPARSVKFQYNLNATMNIPVSDGWSVNSRVDVNHNGKQFIDNLNTGSFGKRTLVNFRLGVQGEKFGIFAWGTNIFNEVYAANAISQPRLFVQFQQRVPEVYLGELRRFGLTVTGKF